MFQENWYFHGVEKNTMLNNFASMNYSYFFEETKFLGGGVLSLHITFSSSYN